MNSTRNRPARICGAGVVAVCLALLAETVTAAPPNVLLARGRTEPSVAIDTAHPATLVVASNTNYSAPVSGTYPPAFFTSHDAGRSFHAANAPELNPYTTGADPTVAAGPGDSLLFSYLGETPSYCSGGHSAVLLTTSNGGNTFRSPNVVDSNPADDKPSMTVRIVKGTGAHVYVTWTRWLNHSSEIWYARSTNGGAKFGRPQMLWASAIDNFGSVPVVGPRRHLYIFWTQFKETSLTSVSPAQVLVRVSTDDGRHFGPARGVAPAYVSIPPMAAPGSLRNLPGPTAAVDRQGNVYVAWSRVTQRHADGSVSASIVITRSTNGGRAWKTPHDVSDTARNDRFMPTMTVLPDGTVGVAFYDRRNSVWQLDTYAARVSFVHGFHRSPNVRVNASVAPISDIYYIAPGSTCFSPGRFFGDYIGVAAGRDNTLCVVWSDSGLRVANETDIWFARVTLPALPTLHTRRRGGRVVQVPVGVDRPYRGHHGGARAAPMIDLQ